MTMGNPLHADRTVVSHPSKSSPLLVPPPLRRGRSPYACIPLPPVHDHGDRCHAALISIHAALRSKSAVQFDLRQCPSTVTLPDHHPLTGDILASPATDPPLPCLSITSPLLPWSITVLPSSPHSWNASVTVSDVLDTLHLALDLSMTEDELDELGSGDVRAVAEACCGRRVLSHDDRRAQESGRRPGVKRIDLLKGQTRFQGLSIRGRQRDKLVLHVC